MNAPVDWDRSKGYASRAVNVPKLESFTTARMRGREFAPTDRQHLLAFVRDPSQLEHMLLFLTTEAEADSFLAFVLEEAAKLPRLQWHVALESRTDGRFLGSACLMLENEAPTSAELGYWFAREAWGKGLATEASAALLEMGFERLGLHRIWGKCHERNPASARVMEKLGMRYEGTLREHVWLRDHYRSSRLFAILESEYRALKAAG